MVRPPDPQDNGALTARTEMGQENELQFFLELLSEQVGVRVPAGVRVPEGVRIPERVTVRV